MKNATQIKQKASELRITSGTAKNKKLKVPLIEGFRSVQEVAKQAVFSILVDKVKGAQCLDLFAGSGNLGLEALSRGAEHCVFVDDSYESVKAIAENAKNCGFEGKYEVVRSNSVKFTSKSAENGTTFDLVFLDPFYTDISHIFLMKNLEKILKERGILIFFHSDNLDVTTLLNDTDLNIIDERRFGKSIFTLIAH